MRPALPLSLFLLILTHSWGHSQQKLAVKSGVGSPAALKLKKTIESIVSPKRQKDLEMGIVVQSMTNRELLYEVNPDQLLIPASLCKIVTSYSVLKRLKPTGAFKTTVYTGGPIQDGKLLGDLYIKGGGDPSLVSERVWMLVNDLIRSGIRTVSGHLIGDPSFFDLEKTPESRPKYLKDQAYNAPIGALSFNFNTTTIYVRPGSRSGVPPIVFTDPQNSYVEVVNQATTGAVDTKNSLVVSRTDPLKGDLGDTVLLRGSLPFDSKELRFYRNIVNPTLYTLHMLKQFMEQRGITVQGKVMEGLVPTSAKQILEFDSLPMWQVVWGMNKFSNNFVADQLLKKLGAEVWGPPGTLEKGLTAITDVLENDGITPRSYEIKDGSGLTRGTRFSANQLIHVLSAAHRDFSISAEFIASLGIAGEDGTLKNRFPSSPVQSVLRAKTGSLDGVASLGGYVPSADGELLGFIVLFNDPKTKYGRMSTWADQVAEAISKFSRQ